MIENGDRLEYKLLINNSKTIILVCSKQALDSNIIINNEKLETVQCHTYLGSKITYDGKSKTGIQSRIVHTKQVFYKKENFSRKYHQFENHKSSYNEFCVECSIEAGKWTILKLERIRVEDFKTWCWRRIQKIPRTEKVKNDDRGKSRKRQTKDAVYETDHRRYKMKYLQGNEISCERQE